ncbi:hypothetical protein [uncultured Marinobacter sp.]|uniref:hypothetical protein n=1 Tax=uncultured Marinobacter sp. TaxID=187379 RepID=UPI00262A0927|nr:hypothetical protein [uncultured Marinobacter sp.]
MEPIRPDDDELRAESPIGSASRKSEPASKPKASSSNGPVGGNGGARVPKARKSNGGGSGGGSRVGLWLALVVLAVVAGGGWFSQEKQIEALESQLEEADYWVRQSKLALARFEGDLSETGESLEEKGQSIEQTLADQEERLDAADSEIRKLWVIANERNKKRLDEHDERLESLAGGVEKEVAAREQLAVSVNDLESSLGGELAALRKELGRQIATLKESTEQADKRLTELNSALEGVDQLVDRRIQRFEREQKLGIDGLEGRIGALEKNMEASANGSDVRALRSELGSLKRTVNAIDSSRAQLTARLVRLSEQVDELRSQTLR